jgi:hypothetical protein
MSNLESSFRTLAHLEHAFSQVGCTEILVKFLSPNQDNEKNQVYFGKSLSLAQFFPGQLEMRQPSLSVSKSNSAFGKSIVALRVDFAWLWPGEEPSAAPNAAIIEYAQYPEVRFSGFLSKCQHGPKALRRQEQDEYGQRVLILGVSGDKVFGSIVTDSQEPEVVGALRDLPRWPLESIFGVKKINAPHNQIDADSLITELKALSGLVHRPQFLRQSGGSVEFLRGGKQAGGWTLEALLGIPRNAKSAPDKYGFEIKAVGASKTSLITTEPDFGYRAENGVAAYLERFGRDAQVGSGKRVFSGVHKCGKINEQTDAFLTIENWNFDLNLPTGYGQPNIVLIDRKTDTIISGWSFAKIGASWTKKHAGAIYVETLKVEDGTGEIIGYKFGPRSYLGLGTSALRFMRHVGLGQIMLDPGDSQTPGSAAHARTQWRVDGSIGTLLPKRLSPLYEAFNQAILHD